jgi:DNA-binding CsgD family transcriptional regulator/tetratricopeptide (TPR) repeat protein
MELLERQTELGVFEEALADAARGEGRVLLVAGEAGIGKTTLTRELAQRAEDRARVLVGACDDLLTPRTLGPFRDLQLGESAPLRRALDRSADRDAVFAAVIDEFSDPLRPTVVVVEDAHWADEATRDVLAFLGRRVAGMPTVLVVTYRDELTTDHPLRSVLGTLAGRWVRRLPLRPLSADAISTLASASAITPERLQQLTGGNPFLVAEVLAAADPSSVPLTVRDAVAARMQTLGPAARDVLTLLSVAPGGLELELLTRLAPSAMEDVAATERIGLTELGDARVRFRHDLLREAVAATATTAMIGHGHARILEVLEQGDPDPSRAAHHAVGAGDVAAILRYAPAAARKASAVGSHRDAIALYEQALRHEAQLTDVGLIRLLRPYAFELYLANRQLDALGAVERAVQMLEAVGPATFGDRYQAVLGKTLTLRSHVACWAARPAVALEAASRAIELLDAAAPSGASHRLALTSAEARALAYANRSFVHCMQGRYAEGEEDGIRALELSADPDLQHVRPYALVQAGASRSLAGDATGDRWLLEGIELAQADGVHEYVPLGCAWISTSALRHGRHDDVERWSGFGIRYSEEHQMEIGLATLRLLYHELEFRRGDVRSAEEALTALAADRDATGWGQSAACTLLGRLLARRGDDAAAFDLLSRGWRLAKQSGEPERIGRAGAGWYEWALLYEDPTARRWGDEAFAATRGVHNRLLLGEQLRLRAELDAVDAPDAVDRGAPDLGAPDLGAPDLGAPDLGASDLAEAELGEPWLAGLRGHWREAAAAWATLGWPYEQARELAASGEVATMVEALAIYDRLGADRTAWQLRRRLRERGVQRVPRGPARDTKANPAGLTGRQLEVLVRVARGLTNAQIADELVLSTRTVDHHVSAVLGKLGVPSRAAAADLAVELGILEAQP